MATAPPEPEPSQPAETGPLRWASPLVVFVLALAVTGALAGYIARSVEQSDRSAFEAESLRTADAIEERIRTVLTLLQGAGGLFAVGGSIDRAEFASYVSQLRLAQRYPGVRGIGLTERIEPADLAAREAYWRSQWGPAFRHWPPGGREAPDPYHAVVLLEPLDERNRAAIGFDMFSEPVRRAAMAAARDSGEPRASGKVTLVQEIDAAKQAGFVIYLPLYAGSGPPATREARRRALRGFVYSPLRTDDLLRGTRGTGQRRIDYVVYDGGVPDPGAQLRNTAPDAGRAPWFTLDRRLDVAGRPWLLRFTSSPFFELQSQRRFLPALLLVPLGTSVLLAWLNWVQARERIAVERADAQRRNHLAELLAADRRKDEFLAMLAHELRNPLAPIRTSLEIIRRAPGTPLAVRARDVAERQTVHMVRLIDDLLDVTRITRGTIRLLREPVSLARALEVAVETSLPQLQARGHRLELAPVDPALTVIGDAARLAQVFSNLLNNAATYSDAGGRISVTERHDGACVWIAVSDTGIGIEPDALPHIFDLFMQDSRTRERGSGLGIGLTLVQRLVQMHGGEVEARSAGRGQGSEFTVRLPLAARAAAPAPAPPTLDGRRPAPAAPLDILVVDDNVDAADGLAQTLALDGHHVSVANDGRGALTAVSARRPDLVLLDIGLPDLDGYEVARRIRAQSGAGGGGPRLVAVTGWGQQEDRERAQQAGFDLHLVKPIDHAALNGHLERLFAET